LAAEASEVANVSSSYGAKLTLYTIEIYNLIIFSPLSSDKMSRFSVIDPARTSLIC
jgi:hypothetical protein